MDPASLVAVAITGRCGGLRPLDASADASSLHPLAHDENVDITWAEMKVGPFADPDAFAAHVGDLAADPKRAFFAVESAEGKVVGWLCLMEARPAQGLHAGLLG